MAGFDPRIFSMYNPEPIESPQNALMRGLEIQRARQTNALQDLQMRDLHEQRQLAIEQAKEAARQRAAQQQFAQSLPSPQMAASQAALAGGGGPTMANAEQMRPVDPRLQMLHGAMRAGAMSPMDYIKEANPGQKLQAVGMDQNIVDMNAGGRVVTPGQAKQADDPFVRLLRQSGIDPASPQGQQLIQQRLQKEATHQPAAMAISYGSPVPVDLGGGKIGYAQPGNRPGAAPQMMNDASGQPLTKPVDAKEKDLTEAAAKATTYLGQMRSATKVLSDLGLDHSALSSQAETALAGGPMNVAVRDKAQRARQAQDQWSEAFLRFKTGAASTPAEVAANRKTFFPVFGDRPETIQQKAQMRLQAERDLEIPAGRGAKQLTEPASGGVPAAGAVRRYNPATGRIE